MSTGSLSKRNQRTNDPSADVRHFIGYHSQKVMRAPLLGDGEPIPAGETFVFRTKRNYRPATLRGARLWAVESTMDKPCRYRLVATGLVETVKAKGELFFVTARVDVPLSPTEVSPAKDPWFAELQEEQNNFRNGLAPIKSAAVIATLEAIRNDSRRTSAPRDATEGSSAPDEPLSEEDARRRVLRAIAERQGQPAFREALLAAYENRCAISDCDAPEALEAAHIRPYMGPQSNRSSNGLLLRADLHTLFDRGLLSVDSSTWTVLVAPTIRGTVYGKYHGAPLRLPAALDARPDVAALNEHRARADL